MSALTDLFTSMANKIRSKTGGSDTYTPSEMVSDGIDDVYEAGVAAGTPTLTGNATAADVVSGKTFYNTTTTKQTGSFAADTVNNSATATTSQATKSPASGKYFANFTINPQQHSETYTPAANTSNNDMGAVHNKRYVNTSGMIVPSGNKAITANGTGIDVSSYATASVSVTGTSVTPSASGTYFASGLNNMTSSGYAYSSQPQVQPTETVLWTNDDPTSSFSGKTVYTPRLEGYDQLKITFRFSASNANENTIYLDIADFLKTYNSAYPFGSIALWASDGTGYRYFLRTVSNGSSDASTSSSVKFGDCKKAASGVYASANDYCIPVEISGITY